MTSSVWYARRHQVFRIRAMNVSPTTSSVRRNRPSSAVVGGGGGVYQPRATLTYNSYNPRRRREVSYSPSSYSPTGSPSGTGGLYTSGAGAEGGGGSRDSSTPTPPPSASVSRGVVGGRTTTSLPPSASKTHHHRSDHSSSSAAAVSPGLRMLESSVNRAHAASLRPRPRSSSALRPASSSSFGGGGAHGGQVGAGASWSHTGSGAGSQHHLVTSHSPYALVRFPEQPPKMAGKLTERDAEKIVVQLKADFNAVAGKTLKMSKMLERMKEEETMLQGQLRMKKSSPVAARLEELKMRLDQVAWDHEIASAQRATHEHVVGGGTDANLIPISPTHFSPPPPIPHCPLARAFSPCFCIRIYIIMCRTVVFFILFFRKSKTPNA